MSPYADSDYRYLNPEDRTAAQAARVTEDEFLVMCGGLKGYADLAKNRAAARSASVNNLTFQVPPLPQTTDEFVTRLYPGVEPKLMLKTLVREQIDKVAGIAGAVEQDALLKRYYERNGIKVAGIN